MPYPRPIHVFGGPTQSDTFDIQRQKINQLSEEVGNLDLLTTDVTSDIVSVLNDLDSNVTNLGRRLFIRAIATS